jgi:hypothetical protein
VLYTSEARAPRVLAHDAVMRGRPDGNATALASAIIEIGREPGASANATLVRQG